MLEEPVEGVGVLEVVLAASVFGVELAALSLLLLVSAFFAPPPELL